MKSFLIYSFNKLRKGNYDFRLMDALWVKFMPLKIITLKIRYKNVCIKTEISH